MILNKCKHQKTKVIYDDEIIGSYGMLIAPKTEYKHWKLLVCINCGFILKRKIFLDRKLKYEQKEIR